MVLEQKMSVQEVSLLIKQEQELFYSSSNLIFCVCICKYYKDLNGKCLQLYLLSLRIYSIKCLDTNPYTVILKNY